MDPFDAPKTSGLVSNYTPSAALAAQMKVAPEKALAELLKAAKDAFAEKTYRKANVIYQTVLDAVPGQIVALKGTAKMALNIRKYGRAVKILRAAVETHPDDPELREMMGDALSGVGDHDAALKQYDRARYEVSKSLSRGQDDPHIYRLNLASVGRCKLTLA